MNRKIEEEYRRREEEKQKWIQYHIMQQENAKKDEEIMRKKREKEEHPKFGSRSAKWTTTPRSFGIYKKEEKLGEPKKECQKLQVIGYIVFGTRHEIIGREEGTYSSAGRKGKGERMPVAHQDPPKKKLSWLRRMMKRILG